MAKTIKLITETYMFKGSEALYGAGKPFATASGITVAAGADLNRLPLVDTAELMRVDILARWNVSGKNPTTGRTKSIRVFSVGTPAGRTAFKTAVAAGITYDGYEFKVATSSGRRLVLK